MRNEHDRYEYFPYVLILIILEVLYEYPNLQERVKEYMS